MTTSQPMSLTSVISRSDEKITPEQLGYLQAYAQDRAHDVVRKLFMEASDKGEVTRAFLSRRLGKSPAQITRWLAVPGNWTLVTFADLLAAMGYVPVLSAMPADELMTSNYYHPMNAADFGIVPSEPKSSNSETAKLRASNGNDKSFPRTTAIGAFV